LICVGQASLKQYRVATFSGTVPFGHFGG